MSAVNYDLMLQEMLTRTAGKVNQFIYWSKPLDWHNQTLTPNPDAIYFMAFFNTKEGPIVVEVPPVDGGEGDRSLQYWREAHTRYFTRLGRYAPDMMLWCERLELVERIG
jgi:hypothetical protein